jgi:pantetheine-phosphate adenylyltransferase
MANQHERIALYPGSFDPPTNGHQWVIERVADQYDKGIVAIGINPLKSGRFPLFEREEMLREITAKYPTIRVTSFPGLYQVDFAEMLEAQYIIRGTRNGNDFGYEADISLTNRTINPNIETVFLSPPKELLQVSSSMVMGLSGYEGYQDVISTMVPQIVFKHIIEQQKQVDIDLLKNKWNMLWERVGAKGNSETIFQDLVSRYTESHRKYHTLQHIKSCLNELDLCRSLIEQPDAVEVAIWFHDAIHEGSNTKVAGTTNDECDSADLAQTILTHMGLDKDVIDHVTSLILSTRHKDLPKTQDEKFMVDIDLAILGRSERIFDIYERNIRLEYGWVSDNEFVIGRTKVLSKFLPPCRSSIFQTEFFQERYETNAVKNLTRSIVQLMQRE